MGRSLKNGCNEMSIKTIARSEFDQLLPCQHSALDSLMVEEVEWFSNRSGSLLGAVAKGSGVAGWNYAIVKRDRKGGFRVRKVMSNFFNVKAARTDLLLSMAGIEKIDCANRGTANFWLPSMLVELTAAHPD